MIEIEPLEIPEVLRITPPRFGDARGFFSESWNAVTWAARGVEIPFVQDNHSFSAPRGTLRGLHFQAPPAAQDKLIRVIQGSILDVAVDIRRGSPTYGRWVSAELSAENGAQLLVPKGFLHGFATLTDDVHVLYKCSDVYNRDAEGAVIWNDPDLGIDWGLGDLAPTLSDKDAIAPAFADLDSPFAYEGATP